MAKQAVQDLSKDGQYPGNDKDLLPLSGNLFGGSLFSFFLWKGTHFIWFYCVLDLKWTGSRLGTAPHNETVWQISN